MAGGVEKGGEEGGDDEVTVSKVMGIVRGTWRLSEDGLEAQLRQEAHATIPGTPQNQ